MTKSILVALLLLVLSPLSTLAAERSLVVRSDRGGLISAKLDRIAQLRATGQRVEIRGTCLSSCTMMLGLPNLCITPSATFGFHGPSSYGRPLHPNDFERWSIEIANHYSPRLRAWYLQTGRYKLNGYYKMRGAALIEMGYPAC